MAQKRRLWWNASCTGPGVSLLDVSRPCSTPCQEILLWFLRHSGVPEALWVLQQLSGLQAPEQPAAASLSFRAGSEGGARPCSRQRCRYGRCLATSATSC